MRTDMMEHDMNGMSLAAGYAGRGLWFLISLGLSSFPAAFRAAPGTRCRMA